MKIFVFRCRSRPQMYAATKYETGSNLPASQSPHGGWLFAELVNLKAVHSTSKFGIDIEELRRTVRQQGYHVWDSGAPARAVIDSATALAPPPLATGHGEPPSEIGRAHV